MHLRSCLILFLCIPAYGVKGDDLRLEAEASLQGAIAFFYSINIHGGYVYNVTPDLSRRWGEEPGDKGFYTMSDGWFDEYNYEVMVDRSYLSEELLRALDAAPIVLKPWDPMGALAL